MQGINWGIMGAGRISYRFATALALDEDARLVAVAGRTAAKLDAFASEHYVAPERRYASADDGGAAAYRRLIDDPDIDAIYLSLPHGMHAEWACRALRAGKAVLCEKPAVVTEAEAQDIAAATRESGALFMEAMKNRFCPLRDRVWDVLRSGELGAVTSVTSVQKLTYGDAVIPYLLDPRQGGALFDMGCYGVGWIEELTQGDPQVDRLAVRWRKVESGRVDWADDVYMTLGGVPVHLVLDGEAGYESLLTIACERGSVEVERLHRPERATVTATLGKRRTIEAPFEKDDFYGEIAHFNALLREGSAESPVMPLASTVRNARIIDAVRAHFDEATELL